LLDAEVGVLRLVLGGDSGGEGGGMGSMNWRFGEDMERGLGPGPGPRELPPMALSELPRQLSFPSPPPPPEEKPPFPGAHLLRARPLELEFKLLKLLAERL